MKKKLTTVDFRGTKEQEEKLLAVIEKHAGQKGAMMPILQEAQEIYGYLPVEVQKIIAAKTGTSEISDLDVENNAWLVAFAPIDDPKIVVVVYIQNGYAGSHASPAAIDVIEYYLDSLGYSENTQIGIEYSLAD